MTDAQLIQLNGEVQALRAHYRVMDQNLAGLQGMTRALDLVIGSLVLTHPNLKAVRQAIAENAPSLLGSAVETHPMGAAMRSTLNAVDGTINRELHRREQAKPATE